MQFNLISIFPEFFDQLKHGVLGKAKDLGLISLNTINPRNFSNFKNKKIDDNQFGDEDGMVMMAEPLTKAVKSIHHKRRGNIILMSPQGKTLDHRKVVELSNAKFLTIVCGRYEGIDQRFIDNYVDDEISIGDYVVTGGELPALILQQPLQLQLRYLNYLFLYHSFFDLKTRYRIIEESISSKSFFCFFVSFISFTNSGFVFNVAIRDCLILQSLIF